MYSNENIYHVFLGLWIFYFIAKKKKKLFNLFNFCHAIKWRIIIIHTIMQFKFFFLYIMICRVYRSIFWLEYNIYINFYNRWQGAIEKTTWHLTCFFLTGAYNMITYTTKNIQGKNCTFYWVSMFLIVSNSFQFVNRMKMHKKHL